MTSHNMHSSQRLRGGGGGPATTETIVHLSTIQITVLSRLFADAISSWVSEKHNVSIWYNGLTAILHLQFLALYKVILF